MAVSYVGVGTQVSGDHDDILTPTLPSGLSTGNLLMAFGYLRNAGTLAIDGDWILHSNVDTVQNGSSFYLSTWYDFVDGSQAAPTISVTGGSTSPQTLTKAWVVAFQGVSLSAPFGTDGADSFNATAANIGPITAATAVLADAAVLVFGVRNGTVMTSAATLTGDGLTWVEAVETTNTVAGLGISLVLDYALWSPVPTLTSKTFVLTGGASSPGFGKMFLLNPIEGLEGQPSSKRFGGLRHVGWRRASGSRMW